MAPLAPLDPLLRGFLGGMGRGSVDVVIDGVIAILIRWRQ